MTFRFFQGEADFACLAAIESASENADHLPVKISAADVAEHLNHIPRLDLFHDLIIAEVDGQEAGYGYVRWGSDATRCTYWLTGYILPAWRRRGIGRALLAWLENRARAIARDPKLAIEDAASLPRFFHVNATQYQEGLHALVRQAGYGVKESWVLMVRPNLEDIPDVALPAGLEVRPALPEQYSDIWYAVCEAYVPEGGPPPTRAFPEDLKNDPNFQPELWQVAWEGSRVVGSVMTYINHAENRELGIRRGFTEGISTVPDWQRRGVATALIARSLKVQREAGMTESALVCSGEKPNNYRLYASCGFQEIKRDTVYEKPVT